MTPLEWLISKQSNPGSFARALRPPLEPSTVWRYVHGKTTPSYSIMVVFHDASGGKIGIEDWKRVFKMKTRPSMRMRKIGKDITRRRRKA